MNYLYCFVNFFNLFHGGNVSQGQLIELDPSMASNHKSPNSCCYHKCCCTFRHQHH